MISLLIRLVCAPHKDEVLATVVKMLFHSIGSLLQNVIIS